MNKNNFSIIIVSYNKCDIILSCIKSIRENLKNENYELIIIDNNSSENNVLLIKKEFPEIIIVENKTNYGFGKACNQGAALAKYQNLVFCNSDIIFQDNPIGKMIDFISKNNNIGVVGAQLFNPDGSKQPSYFRFPNLFLRFLQLSGLKELILKIKDFRTNPNMDFFSVDFVSGAFFLIPKNIFLELNGFDEDYFMYLEDADLGYRIFEKGYLTYMYNTSSLIHLHQNHENNSSFFVKYHMAKGNLIFYFKNYGVFQYLLLVFISLIFFIIRGLVNPFKIKEYFNLIWLYLLDLKSKIK